MSAPEPADVDPGSSGPRVGYVLKMYPRFSETFVVTEILALEALGVEVDIFSLRPPADGRFHDALAQVSGQVTYLPHHVRSTALWDVLREGRPVLPELGRHLDVLLELTPDEAAAAVQLAQAVRERGLTHLHAHFGSVATTVARAAARLARIDYTFTAHAKDIFHEEVHDPDLRCKLRDARATVTVSEFNHAFLTAKYGSDAAALVRIYNGLDLQRFDFHDPIDRPPVIAAVGRLVAKKGFTDLVDAIGLMVAENRPVRLVVAGTGPEEAALRDRVRERGLEDHVELLGALAQSAVRDLLVGCAVLAAPCVVAEDGNRDGLPTVLLEGLAVGTPCVATTVTGIPEAVRHEETGLLVPPADPPALARALSRLLDDPELGRRLARRGRALVEREFDARRSAARLREVFAPPPSSATSAPQAREPQQVGG